MHGLMGPLSQRTNAKASKHSDRAALRKRLLKMILRNEAARRTKLR